MKKIFFIILVLLSVCCVQAYADGVDSVLDSEARNSIQKIFDNAEIEFNALDVIDKLNSGDFTVEFDSIIKYFKINVTKIFKGDLVFITHIFILVMLSALIENMYTTIKSDRTVNLVVTGIVVLSLINLTYDVAEFSIQMIDRLIMFINSLIPTLMTFLATSGKIGTSGVLNPIMIGVSSVISLIIKSFVIPMSIIGLVLKLTGDVTEKKYLVNFGNQLYKLLKWTLGLVFTIYVGIISIVGVAAPKVDEITLKTTKYAVGSFIPYVGGMLADSVDLILACSTVVKNSVGIAGLAGIISIVAVPCIKIVVKVIIINILSVTVSPVAGKAVVSSINNVSAYLGILLGMLVVVSIMYILSITVIIFVGGA